MNLLETLLAKVGLSRRDPATGFVQGQDLPLCASDLSAMHAATMIWCNALAQCRFRVYDVDSEGTRTPNTTAGIARVLGISPNELETPAAFADALMVSLLRHGRAVVRVWRNERGGIARAVVCSTSTPVPGAVGVWDVQLPAEFDSLGTVERIQPEDAAVIYMPNRAAPWAMAASAAGVAGEAMAFLAHWNKAAVRPSSWLGTDQALTDVQMQQIRAAMDRQKNGGKVVLPLGIKPLADQRNPMEGETAKAVQIGLQGVALAYGVPAEALGVRTAGSQQNATELMAEFRAQSFSGMAVRIAQAFAKVAGLTPDQIELDTTALSVLNILDLVSPLNDAVRGTILTPNEARKRLALAPVADGNVLIGQMQMAPLTTILANGGTSPMPATGA